MTRRLFTVICAFFLLAFIFTALHCGSKDGSNLSITVNPTQPIVIDQGSTLTLASGETVTPPYFAINNFKVTWSSTTDAAQILALKFVATNGSGSECAFSGDDIKALFSSVTFTDSSKNTQTMDLVDSNGNVTIPKVVNNYVITYTTSILIYCGGLTIANTSNSNIYSSYNVPMAVALYGQTVDATGDATGRLTAVTNITLQ